MTQLDGIILSSLIDPIFRTCEQAAPLETMGFLIGYPIRLLEDGARKIEEQNECFTGLSNRRATYIHDFVAGPTEATRTHVRFSEDVLARISYTIRTKYKRSFIVGWFHSHPGYGCFLSPTDVHTQRSYFSEAFHLAYVVDPIRREHQFFKLAGNNYRPARILSTPSIEIYYPDMEALQR